MTLASGQAIQPSSNASYEPRRALVLRRLDGVEANLSQLLMARPGERVTSRLGGSIGVVGAVIEVEHR